MPPKKEEKDKKKAEDPAEAKFQEEIRQLEQAKNDLMVEQTFLMDKFRQMKAENDRLKGEIDGFKARLNNATDDYADILEHRQEQIKAEEGKLKGLQQQVEKLEDSISRYLDEIKALKDSNSQQAVRLDEAGQMLRDKDNLEEAVRKQHDLIEKQSEELRSLKKQLHERDGALDKAKSNIEELVLKSSATTELKILFEEPWLVQLNHSRLKGDVPLDRDFSSLLPLASGKQLVLYGGVSKTAGPAAEAVGREVAVLNMETMAWERPGTARSVMPCHAHAAIVVARTKILVCGGIRGEMPSSDVSTLNTDTMKWFSPQLKGLEKPMARSGHASCCIREKVFVFGGITGDGTLLNDLWIFDQDSSQWAYVTCYGTLPSPRKGCSITPTEDGRRLYVFGGNDGVRALNDVAYLDLEKLFWSHVPVHMGALPEPREDHAATITAKYLIISGGCSAGGVRRLTDTQVLDLYSPRWEVLDDGAWGNNMMWLKQHSSYSCFAGSRLYTLKPNMHERLWELQVMDLQLPEDIERLRNNKKRDLGYADKLELMDDAVCTHNSMELRWRPPTKNAERIERYKLMIATSTGVVKDVYQGKDTLFRIVGLKSNTEYILCVKAIYDDGSFLWSESKAYRTHA